jgi:DNA-directed RNA polymerase specialized sigma24 family protein
MKYHDISSLMRKNREQAFLYLYQQLYPKVERCILNMGGQIEDAKDIFQDSLIVFYEKSLDPSAIQIDSVHAYIIGISKKLWLSKSQKHKKAVEEQQAVYPYIKWLGRRSLKKEIQAIEKKYFQL